MPTCRPTWQPHGRPSGTTITLDLIRLPASGPARRIGSIFINPGGPGKSGVDAVRGGGRSLFSAQVRARFDLVGLDFPVTAAEERVWVDADRTFARACVGPGGPLDHMATAEVARDLDLLTTRTPQPGTVCPPDIVPFAHPSAQTAGSPTKPARS